MTSNTRRPLDVVGVDGCPFGWFSVRLPHSGEPKVEKFRTFEKLLDYYGDVGLVLVDIPIGLPEGPEGRECDRQARKLVGSAVFPVPTRQTARQALASPKNYEAACNVESSFAGKKISRQTFGIAPKIGEVDEVMRARQVGVGPRVREVHPEVCFWGLNGRETMRFSKKTWEGEHERVRLLQTLEPRTDHIIADATRSFLRKDVGRDDILDALVVAVTGLRSQGVPLTLPGSPRKDNSGLPMEMVYWG